MEKERSKLLLATDWMLAIEKEVPSSWPVELPKEGTAGFWECATRFEFKTRTIVSRKTALLIEGGGSRDPLTPLEAFFYKRRVEFASQILFEFAKLHHEPSEELGAFLKWLLVASWEKDGCIGFWNHAMERDGKPHPDTPPEVLKSFRA